MEKIDLKRKHKITDAELYQKITKLQNIVEKWVKNNDCSFYIQDRCEITKTDKSQLLKFNKLVGYLRFQRYINNQYWYSQKLVQDVNINYGISELIKNISLQSKKKINKLFYNTNKGDINFFKVRKIVRFLSSYFGWYINRHEKPDTVVDARLEKGYFKSYSYECRVLDIIQKKSNDLLIEYSDLVNSKEIEKDSIDWIYKSFGYYA